MRDEVNRLSRQSTAGLGREARRYEWRGRSERGRRVLYRCRAQDLPSLSPSPSRKKAWADAQPPSGSSSRMMGIANGSHAYASAWCIVAHIYEGKTKMRPDGRCRCCSDGKKGCSTELTQGATRPSDHSPLRPVLILFNPSAEYPPLLDPLLSCAGAGLA